MDRMSHCGAGCWTWGWECHTAGLDAGPGDGGCVSHCGDGSRTQGWDRGSNSPQHETNRTRQITT